MFRRQDLKSHSVNVNLFHRSNLESLESNKDLLALHNGAWSNQDSREGIVVGQDKIIRAFGELMRNMARMKTFIRPSMCKPYGKQSESLQKSEYILLISFLIPNIVENGFENWQNMF